MTPSGEFKKILESLRDKGFIINLTYETFNSLTLRQKNEFFTALDRKNKEELYNLTTIGKLIPRNIGDYGRKDDKKSGREASKAEVSAGQTKGGGLIEKKKVSDGLRAVHEYAHQTVQQRKHFLLSEYCKWLHQTHNLTGEELAHFEDFALIHLSSFTPNATPTTIKNCTSIVDKQRVTLITRNSEASEVFKNVLEECVNHGFRNNNNPFQVKEVHTETNAPSHESITQRMKRGRGADVWLDVGREPWNEIAGDCISRRGEKQGEKVSYPHYAKRQRNGGNKQIFQSVQLARFQHAATSHRLKMFTRNSDQVKSKSEIFTKSFS